MHVVAKNLNILLLNCCGICTNSRICVITVSKMENFELGKLSGCNLIVDQKGRLLFIFTTISEQFYNEKILLFSNCVSEWISTDPRVESESQLAL